MGTHPGRLQGGQRLDCDAETIASSSNQPDGVTDNPLGNPTRTGLR